MRSMTKLGGLDVLVNNAGIGMRTVNTRFMTDPQPFWEVSEAGFHDVLTTKATGTFLVSSAVVPQMLDDGRGRVITISMSERTIGASADLSRTDRPERLLKHSRG